MPAPAKRSMSMGRLGLWRSKMSRQIANLPHVTVLGAAKRLTCGIFGPYVELNGNLQDVA